MTTRPERDSRSRRRRVVGHDYSLRMQGLFLLSLFPTPALGYPFIVLFLSVFLGGGSRRFVPYTRLCSFLARGRHPVAFRLYLSSTACLLVAQALYIKRQGACYRALCRRGGLTVENEASASYADLSPNQYDVVAPLFTFIPLLRPLSRTLPPFLSTFPSLSLPLSLFPLFRCLCFSLLFRRYALIRSAPFFLSFRHILSCSSR